MVGLPHQLQHRWCGGGNGDGDGLNGDGDGVGGGVGAGGGDGDDGAPSTQCVQPGCGVA